MPVDLLFDSEGKLSWWMVDLWIWDTGYTGESAYVCACAYGVKILWERKKGN